MKNWNEVRAKAVAEGRMDEARVNEAKDEMLQAIRAHRLAEIRSARGLRQEDMAERLHVSQSRISRLERGNLDASQLSTLKAYAEALGGTLEVRVRFDDDLITVL